jgi:hypothetical protein
MSNLKSVAKLREQKAKLQDRINNATKVIVITEDKDGNPQVFFDNVGARDLCYYAENLSRMAETGITPT